jgi:hypothetical protein
MKHSIDEKVFTNMFEAIKKFEADKQKREEEKRWRPIEIPLSLNEGLNRLTKSELDSIRKRLEIKNASSLKKADLIKLLQEKIPASLEQICNKLDHERYRLLRKLVRHGGHMIAPSLEPHQLRFFQENGVIFTGTYAGEKVFVMPQEIVGAFSAVDNTNMQSIISRNTEWIKLTQGMLYYYGFLKLDKLMELLERYTGERLNLLEYLIVMYDAAPYYREVRIDVHGFSNSRVFDPREVLREQQMRKDLDYYPFSKEQLLKAGEPGFVDRNESYKRFVHFLLKNFDMNKEEADGIAEECVYATRIGENPQDLLRFLQSRVEFSNIQTLSAALERIVELMNNTREWFLKGYTSNELFEEEKKALHPLERNGTRTGIQTKEKNVGRNDPCPCGSNKKYKKCCGK